MASDNLLQRRFSVSPWAIAAFGVLGLGAAMLAWHLTDPNDRIKKEMSAEGPVVKVHKPKPAPINRTPDVLDGFRGDVHPLLHGQTRLDVTANWTPPDRGRMKLNPAPDAVYSWYANLTPAFPRANYTERDFSGFMPESATSVGQAWELDAVKVNFVLKQFHPNASLHLVATGRRAGPDGAFATLRAISPSHLDILFRIHAEFLVTPDEGADARRIVAWYTPAYLLGRMVVNKRTGTVEHFKLGLPTEKSLNVFLTVNPSLLGVPALGHDIVRVDRMELSGGDERLADGLAWDKSISKAEAERRLAKIFYKFEEIDWAPMDQVQTLSRTKNRPIFAIVSWGSTDDQSC